MKINSTNEVLKYLYSLSLDRSSFVFRGQDNYDWTLQPSIYRSYDFIRYQTSVYETHLFSQKPETPQPPLTHTTYDLEWLMLCQHYGVPTRLLDWTSEILIALFFACSSEENSDIDGALFICNKNDYPRFTTYDKPAMETQELAFVNTYIVNPRMRMQSGSFMIWGHAPLDEETTESYDLWECHKKMDGDSLLEKICIPKDAKKVILDELKDIYSITDDSLYIKNGYLEKTYGIKFKQFKENIRLMTIYTTNADSLTPEEDKLAASLFNIKCRNMYGNCVNLRKIT